MALEVSVFFLPPTSSFLASYAAVRPTLESKVRVRVPRSRQGGRPIVDVGSRAISETPHHCLLE
jgi:hypothetical protein